SRMVGSQLPEAMIFPSGLKATEVVGPVCPLRVNSSLPVATSQVLTVSSQLVEASFLPSGLSATQVTDFGCAAQVDTTLAVATSQSLISAGSRTAPAPDASSLPSGL